MKQKLIIASLLTLLAVDSKASAPSSKGSTPRTTCSTDTVVCPNRLERISFVERLRAQGAETRDLLFGIEQQPASPIQQAAQHGRINQHRQFAPPPPMRMLSFANRPEAAQSAPRNNHQNNNGRRSPEFQQAGNSPLAAQARRSPHNNSAEFRQTGNSPLAAQARYSPEQPSSPSYLTMASRNN